MDAIVTAVTVGALLHDIGKLVQRAENVRERHSECGVRFIEELNLSLPERPLILDMIRYHHYRDIEEAKLPDNHPSYIVYEADNIAAGVDRRDIDYEGQRGFEKSAALHTVFNLIRTGGENVPGMYRPLALRDEDGINYPLPSEVSISASDYARLKGYLADNLAKMDYTVESPNSVLEILEATTSYIPSSTDLRQVPDISLYDHLKITAAVAACMYSYFKDQGISDYYTYCFKNAGKFREYESFLLASADISGIQDFIYTISSKGALKSLRARSFYLEIILEQVADEILDALQLTRANLIYSGGGHFYMLLPNTSAAKECIDRARSVINRWMLEMYSTALYIEFATVPVSANVLMNGGTDGQRPNLLGNAFRTLAGMLSRGKMSRYPVSLLQEIMSPQGKYSRLSDSGRECVVCRTSSTDLVEDEKSGGQTFCRNCANLRDLGGELGLYGSSPNKPLFIAIKNGRAGDTGAALSMPTVSGEPAFMELVKWQEAERELRESRGLYRRLYSINKPSAGVSYATNLWLGIYSKAPRDGQGHIEFDELAKDSLGIKRLAVMRADVDNLGKLFSQGFEKETGGNRYLYDSLSRKAVLSRQLSLFFKNHINRLCRERAKRSWTGNESSQTRSLVIVYSGGDDIFVVGAWNEVIDFAIDLYHSFQKYTCSRLTFSAGIALFHSGFPISQMAAVTGELESAAKDNSDKNSVALFGLDHSVLDLVSEKSRKARHLYRWDDFISGVLGDKYRLLKQSLDLEGGRPLPGRLAVGTAALYRWLRLLTDIEEKGERLNLARMAYNLARISPGPSSGDDERRTYEEIRRKLYLWAGEEKDRRELITALNLLIYENRNNG